ncbi:peptidylprolyl isomerase [Variovorax sp. OV329]|uniref:peptidylprolyl isomerase n=1 Tax=Variovorax sp. OV329 TaxID=1882825 RepID=UPI0008E1A7FE|nr:peptidylprolyl isomerase [Variovorax sp. OV329]SFM30222.1 periplasmic chaperone for outer membrane proteins SurA [Variovorax sp. OV329]
MSQSRILYSAIFLAALGAAGIAQAQSSTRSGATASPAPRGITDIMRAGPQKQLPPAVAATPVPTPAPTTTPSGQRVAEYIVALVNSEPITNTEVLSRVQRALRQGGSEVERVPRPELNRMALERIIVEKAQLQQAKELGIKIDDLAVDQAEEGVARQNQMTVTELGRRLAQEGISRDAYRQELRTQITMMRLREREVEPRVKVSDLEVDQYLRDQRSSSAAKAAPDVNIAHVLVTVPENASDAKVAELQQKAQGIAQRARSGEDFSALARDLSDAPDRLNGGALGVRSADRYPPLFMEATQNTPVGGIAGPIRSGAGFHVLKVLSKSQPGEASATVSQTKVRHILLRVDDKANTAQAAQKLAEFKKQIDAGTATFAGLARDNSQDGSAKDGGELGWSRPGMFVPEFEEAMNRLQPGQVSDPVVSRFGVHLIQVEERREAKLSQAEQREAARAVLREKRMEEAYNTWAQEVRGRAYVEFREAPQS